MLAIPLPIFLDHPLSGGCVGSLRDVFLMLFIVLFNMPRVGVGWLFCLCNEYQTRPVSHLTYYDVHVVSVFLCCFVLVVVVLIFMVVVPDLTSLLHIFFFSRRFAYYRILLRNQHYDGVGVLGYTCWNGVIGNHRGHCCTVICCWSHGYHRWL